MLYLVALVFPPLAVLCAGRFWAAVGNMLLTILAWVTFPYGTIPLNLLCVVLAWRAVAASRRQVVMVRG